MRKFKSTLFIAALLCFSAQMFGQDLVYKATNPAFGGDTFNYQWLLSSASALDLTEDNRTRTSSNATTSVDAFAASLERQVLNSLSRELISAQFGEEGAGLTDGTYEFGEFQLDVTTTVEGLSITIFDVNQGQQTQIVIPFF